MQSAADAVQHVQWLRGSFKTDLCALSPSPWWGKGASCFCSNAGRCVCHHSFTLIKSCSSIIFMNRKQKPNKIQHCGCQRLLPFSCSCRIYRNVSVPFVVIVIYWKVHAPGDISFFKSEMCLMVSTPPVLNYSFKKKCTNNQNHIRMQQHQLMFPKHYFL